jgi:tetratricopeptide (TPR) repeat protein
MIALSHVGDTLGNSHMISLGRFAEAAEVYSRVVDRARWLVSVDPQDKKAQVDLGFALLRYGNTLRAAVDYDKAWRAMEESRVTLEAVLRIDPGNAAVEQNLAFLHFQFAELYAARSQWALAIAKNEEAIAMIGKLIKADPADSNVPRMMLECLILHPHILASAGRVPDAVKAAETKSKEPRIRALVARSLELAALTIPEREKDLMAKADAQWTSMEKDGLLIPSLATERDAFRKRLTAASR